jgi:DNA-binding response OmpR family regulator
VQAATALDILLVDDDRPLRDMLSRSFEREGHHVTAVADGQSALDVAAARPFDIVLLDVALGSGPTGHDVARMLRGRRDVVPIIMLTALDSEADAVQGLESGADDYVTKPFGAPELLARMRAALRHRVQARGGRPRVEAGPLAIDLVYRRVTRDGAELRLAPKEWAILEQLAIHAGKVVTHGQLLRKVWGRETETEQQYLRVYVRQLRQKVEPDPNRPSVLVTEPGVGYRLLPHEEPVAEGRDEAGRG